LYLLMGFIRPDDAFLELMPVGWISQPPGYVMVGLAGIVSENTYSGSIVGGYQCGGFFVSRRLIERSPQEQKSVDVLAIPPPVPATRGGYDTCALSWRDVYCT